MIGRASESEMPTSDSLFASARRQAERAFRARGADDQDDAALHFGSMLEHLAKAFLLATALFCSSSPA